MLISPSANPQSILTYIPISLWTNILNYTSTDDISSYVQANIDKLSDSGGGTILFPAGRYVINNIILKDNVALKGADTIRGRASQLFQTAAGGTMIATDNSANGNCSISNFYIQGIGDGTSTISSGVVVNLLSCAITGCTFRFFNDSAIVFSANSIASFIKDTFVYNAVMNRTRSSFTGASHIGGTDHYLDNLESGCSLSGLSSANMYCVGIALVGADCFCDAIHGENSDIGIYIGGSNGRNRLTLCRGDLSFAHGYYIDTINNMLSSCLSYKNSLDTNNTYSGFYLTSNALGNTLAACRQFTPSATANSSKYGFEDHSSTSNNYQKNSYVGCSSQNHVTSAFGPSNTFVGAAVQIINCTSTLASGTTIDVGQQHILRANYSSAQTVTSFINGMDGQEIKIFCNSPNLTIQNNSTIKTISGADLVLAINIMYTFTNFGGIWYQS